MKKYKKCKVCKSDSEYGYHNTNCLVLTSYLKQSTIERLNKRVDELQAEVKFYKKESWVNELAQVNKNAQEIQKQIDYLQYLLLKNREQANDIINDARQGETK